MRWLGKRVCGGTELPRWSCARRAVYQTSISGRKSEFLRGSDTPKKRTPYCLVFASEASAYRAAIVAFLMD